MLSIRNVFLKIPNSNTYPTGLQHNRRKYVLKHIFKSFAASNSLFTKINSKKTIIAKSLF